MRTDFVGIGTLVVVAVVVVIFLFDQRAKRQDMRRRFPRDGKD
jgi:hypothetical protein